MDAARYQQIQDLFWEAEEIDASRWRSFLEDRAGDDQELIDEVISLLQEHNPEAALIEGRKAEPVQFPPTVRGSLETQVAATPKHRSANQPLDRAGVTIASSQRTHASPRSKSAERSKPSTSRRSKSRKTSKTLTSSSGRVASRWSWIPMWISMWLAAMVSIWIAAWMVGRTQIRSDREFGRKILPTVLQEARDRIEPLLLREQVRTRQLSTGRARQVLEILDSPKLDPDIKQKQAEQVITRISYLRDPRFELAVWDAQLNPIVVSPGFQTRNVGDSLNNQSNESQARRLDETLFRKWVPWIQACLKGEFIFCGFQPGKPLSLDGHHDPMGWMVPVYREERDEDGSGVVIGVTLLVRHSLRESVDTILHHISKTGGVDAYLVDQRGLMQSESDLARSLLQLPSLAYRSRSSSENESLAANSSDAENAETTVRIAGEFRVAEYAGIPPKLDRTGQSPGRIPPLTIAASSIGLLADQYDSEKESQSQVPTPPVVQSYTGYTGAGNQGVWDWLPTFQVGLVVERPSTYSPEVFELRRLAAWVAPLAIAWPVALLFSILTIPVVSALTWWHQSQLRAIESGSRPLSRYTIDDQLGSGGMGVVYRAEHKDLGREVAIKLLRSDCQDEDDRHRFDREARLASTLSCPHSVTIFDYGYTTEGDAFCVMELLTGITLAEVVARSGPQPPGRVVWMMQQICQAILEAHAKGLMHRDLKPQNVMLRFDSVVGDWAVVFDFGLAKPIEPDREMFQTADTIWAGTPMYMAPERFREPSNMDPRSDIYSIGCIAYYLLAGNPPFAECDPESMFGLIMTESPIAISTHRGEPVNELLDHWVQKCMAKNKRQRSSDIETLNRELQSIAEVLPWTRSDAEAWWSENGKLG